MLSKFKSWYYNIGKYLYTDLSEWWSKKYHFSIMPFIEKEIIIRFYNKFYAGRHLVFEIHTHEDTLTRIVDRLLENDDWKDPNLDEPSRKEFIKHFKKVLMESHRLNCLVLDDHVIFSAKTKEELVAFQFIVCM